VRRPLYIAGSQKRRNGTGGGFFARIFLGHFAISSSEKKLIRAANRRKATTWDDTSGIRQLRLSDFSARNQLSVDIYKKSLRVILQRLPFYLAAVLPIKRLFSVDTI
jgi:hypothetical protein